MTDNDPMPFGKHKGVKMANVPAEYLLWLKDEIEKTVFIRRTLSQKHVLKYILENQDVLNKEIKSNK